MFYKQQFFQRVENFENISNSTRWTSNIKQRPEIFKAILKDFESSNINF